VNLSTPNAESALDVAEETQSEDWDFVGENTQYSIHGLHPYPARMPPQLARKLISEHSNFGDLVVDPFCGSGTVLVEASLAGRKSIGVDINPLAVLVSKGKTTPIPQGRLTRSISKILDSLSGDSYLDRSNVNFENVDYWFKKHVRGQLAKLRNLIDEVDEVNVRRLFQICLSATVREVSNSRRGEFKPWRLSSRDLRLHRPDVCGVFTRTVLDRARMIHEYDEMLPEPRFGRFSDVILGDARNLSLRRNSVDLIVTSPPYGDSITTVAYGQFSKFSSLWVGLPQHLANRVDQICLGGRLSSASDQQITSPVLRRTLKILQNSESGREARVGRFFADLATSLTGIERCLKRGGTMCLITGNRTVARIRLPTDQILEELVLGAGKFDHEGTYERQISRKVLPWANAPENIPHLKGATIARERIAVFSKQA
jgi:DNA modification methylase